MAEKPNTKTLRFRVSAKLFEYLGTLKRETMIGASENDIAEYLLTQRLEDMRRELYHETQAIPGKPD